MPLGSKLPAEPELCEQHGVSRATIREAVRGLVEEGYLSRAHGSGTFVKFRPRVRHSLERNLSYTELISQAGFEVACRLLEVNTDKPGPDEAERLRINASESVLRLERVHAADGRPVIYLATPGSYLYALDADTGQPLPFSFEGLLFASAIANLPFVVQPIQRAFEAIPADVRDAAACCGLTPWQRFLRIELPLAWPGVVTAAILAFAHTLGEFGVVLMVGGNIPGETRTVSVSVYDSVQAFDYATAGRTSLALLVFSLVVLTAVYTLQRRTGTAWPLSATAERRRADAASS